jgi:hypothetical protein
MGFLSSIFGSKPTVPTYTPVSLADSQSQSISANQAALPSAEKLASGVSQFNQDQLTQMLNSIMPGFSDNSKQIQSNISSELKGQLPTDVIQALQSSDAAQALTGGFGGSGLAGNLTAKDLGLTSLDLMMKGQSAEQSWTSMIDSMYAPGIMSPQSMFISPMQQFDASTKNNENTFNQEWLQAQVNAQPNPVMNGILNIGMQTQSSVLGAYGGGSSYSPIGGGSVSSSQMSGMGGGGGPMSYGASDGDIMGSLAGVGTAPIGSSAAMGGGGSFLSGLGL